MPAKSSVARTRPETVTAAKRSAVPRMLASMSSVRAATFATRKKLAAE
ncbi:hypothetical protein [Halopelagius longus]|nr:hypothetical protein [Halopelagius longus]